jgi:hypothetical protein
MLGVVLFGATALIGPGPSHSCGFVDHTQRRTAVSRTHLDGWSARRRDIYLTRQNTHNTQTSRPPVGFELAMSAGERPQTYILDCTATGTGMLGVGRYELTPKKTGKNLSVGLCSNRSPPSFRPESLSFDPICSLVKAIGRYVSIPNSLVVWMIHNWNHTYIGQCLLQEIYTSCDQPCISGIVCQLVLCYFFVEMLNHILLFLRYKI